MMWSNCQKGVCAAKKARELFRFQEEAATTAFSFQKSGD